MRPIRRLRALLETHGIYRETIGLMRQIAEAVRSFEEGHYYRLKFQDGTVSYMLVGEALKNGAYKALVSDFGRPPVSKTTNYLTPAQWDEITETDLPPKLLTRFQAKTGVFSP
jgi:hypothetical protein